MNYLQLGSILIEVLYTESILFVLDIFYHCKLVLSVKNYCTCDKHYYELPLKGHVSVWMCNKFAFVHKKYSTNII